MHNTVRKHKRHDSNSTTSDLSKYIISFGANTAPNKIEIFYGVECGFSREFLQNDFKHLLEYFVLTGKASIHLYPAALDPHTLAFCELINQLTLSTKRQTFMQLCHPIDYSLLTSRLSKFPIEAVFFDVVKILEQNKDILETLMIRLNGKVMADIPSLYSIQENIL